MGHRRFSAIQNASEVLLKDLSDLNEDWQAKKEKMKRERAGQSVDD
jgi:hypothetical protein